MQTNQFLLGLGLGAVGLAASAASFDGLQLSAGVDATQATFQGSEIYNNAGVDTGLAAGNDSNRRNALKLGAAYGVNMGRVQTTLGVDYIGGRNTISSASDGNGGFNSLDITQRVDLYVAPGLRLNRDSVVYAKLGYSQLAYNNLNNSTTAAALSGAPGNHAVVYGLGFKQKYSAHSPLFYAIEYTSGSTRGGQVVDVNGNGFDSKVKLSSVGLTIGYDFN